MNHPYKLLAEYVDGALPEGERAVVEAHLRDCPECSAEVGPASTARRALTSLKDGSVPEGLSDAVLAEISAPTPARGASRWYRASGLAAAAAIVVLLAVALPRLGSRDDGVSPTTAAGAGDEAPAAPSLAIDTEETNYSSESLLGLLSERSVQATAGEAAPDAALASDPREVLDCLHTALPGLRGRPVRLIRARFQGTAAYIGVFEAGPGGGSPSRAALAASVRGCRLLSYATDS